MKRRHLKNQEFPDNLDILEFIQKNGAYFKKQIEEAVKNKQESVMFNINAVLLPKHMIGTNKQAYDAVYGKDGFGQFACEVSIYVAHMGPLLDFIDKCESVTEYSLHISKTKNPKLVFHL